MKYDLAIIGGGPAGYHAAEKAAAGGLKTILFEKNELGGVCLNEGCIPTKTLLYSAKTLDNIKSASKYGIINKDIPNFDLSKIIARKNKVVRKLTAGIKMTLNNQNIEIIQGQAHIEGQTNQTYSIQCNNQHYQSEYILIASGSETIIPPIQGIDKTNFWTSKEALSCQNLPQNLLIIGGGVIGIEFASFFNSLGVNVCVVEMMPEILGIMDKELSAKLREEYTKKGIQFHLSTKITAINNEGATIQKNNQNQFIQADKILISVGRKAILSNLGLENIGVQTHQKGIQVNSQMQTSCHKVFACGDVTGFSMLAHTAIREALVAINTILNIPDQMSYTAIPGVVYTNPEMAGVGITQEEADQKNIKVHIKKIPMSFSGRFVAENEMTNGLCKILIDEDNNIRGCHILGNPASEIIALAGMAIEKNLKAQDFIKIILPHPTVSEIIQECMNID